MPIRIAYPLSLLLRGAAAAGLLAAAASAPTAPVVAADAAACPVVPVPTMSLPHLKEALAHDEPAIIVAIGSSSTQGWMASDRGQSYPSVLQAALARRMPHAHIAVINRGVGGEDAAEETPRLDSDVVAVHPQVAIWQVGANGALRNVDPAVFRKLVTAGIARLHKAGMDVVLMDNQRSPRILAVPEHAAIDAALAQIAHATDASLFSRGALMDAWARAGSPYTDFVSPDRLHHNDRGYQCLGEAVAASIVEAVEPDQDAAGSP